MTARIAGLISVGKLLEHLASESPWAINVTQRAYEWSELRVTNLVDSILRGFPIGTLIVVENGTPSYRLSLDAKLRELEPTRSRMQIVDGQQRCGAMLASFGGRGLPAKDGRRRHLWINLSDHNRRVREFDEKLGQRYYFHWSASDSINGHHGADRRYEDLPPHSPADGWTRFSALVEAVQRRRHTRNGRGRFTRGAFRAGWAPPPLRW